MPASAAIPMPEGTPPEVAALIGCCVSTGVGAVLKTARVPAGLERRGDRPRRRRPVGRDGRGPGRRGPDRGRRPGAGQARAGPVARGDGDGPGRAPIPGETDAEIRALTGAGPDFTFEAIGLAATIDQAIRLLPPGGTAVLVGMTPFGVRASFEVFPFVDGSRSILGSNYGFAVASVDFPRYAELHPRRPAADRAAGRAADRTRRRRGRLRPAAGRRRAAQRDDLLRRAQARKGLGWPGSRPTPYSAADSTLRHSSGKTRATTRDADEAEQAARDDRELGAEDGRDAGRLEIAHPRPAGHDQQVDRDDPAAQLVGRLELDDRCAEDRRQDIGRPGDRQEHERERERERGQAEAGDRQAPHDHRQGDRPAGPPDPRDPARQERARRRRPRPARPPAGRRRPGPTLKTSRASTGKRAVGIPKIIATRSIAKVDRMTRCVGRETQALDDRVDPRPGRPGRPAAAGRSRAAPPSEAAKLTTSTRIRPGHADRRQEQPADGRADDRGRLEVELVQGDRRRQAGRRHQARESPPTGSDASTALRPAATNATT